jgi:PKD repeat protein
MNLSEVQIGTYDVSTSCNSSGNGIDTSYLGTSVVNLYRGKPYVFRAIASSGANLGIFIDFNRDGDFDDAGEMIGSENNNGSYDSVRSFMALPTSLKTGTTRFRAIAVSSSATSAMIPGNACGALVSMTGASGQSIDFTINIAAYSTDLYVKGFSVPANYSCANSAQPMSVIVQNLGSSSVTSVPITIKSTNTSGTTTTLTQTFSKTMLPDEIDTFSFTSTVSTSTTGIYKFAVYTTLSGDLDHSNDTFRVNMHSTPSVAAPKIVNADICGYNKVTLGAASTTTNSKTLWYKKLSDIKPFFIGDQYSTPTTLTRDTSFYVESTAILTDSLTTQFFGARSNYGEFVDMTAKTDITMDSFNLDLANTISKTETIRIYYRKGGSYKGYETDSSTWTLAGIKTVYPNGAGTPTRVAIGGIVIPAGQTYGMYFAEDPSAQNRQFFYDAGNTYVQNDALLITGATTTGSFFPAASGLTPGRLWDGTVYYHPKACTSGKYVVKARVRAGIPGMTYSQGTPYHGYFNGGIIQNPDAVCPRDTATYQLSGPTNYGNSGYGTKWKIVSVSVKAAGGTLLNDTLTTKPTSTSNFSIRVIPNKTMADSQITISVVAISLVDSCFVNLTRVINVGSLPHANFTFTPACQGADVTFSDSTIVPSGVYLSHIWDFGDGSSATTANPTHNYTSAGSYNVTEKVITQAGCVDAVTKTYTGIPKPKTNFITTASCVGQVDSFVDKTVTSGTITKYYWDFGNGKRALIAKPTTTYTKAGIYPVIYAIQVSTGCIDTLRRTITIVDLPKANFTYSVGCAGTVSNFTNTSTGSTGDSLSYFWDFGDGVTTSTKKNPSNIFFVSQAYSVTLTVRSKYGCTATKSVTVTPPTAPSAKIGMVPACTGNPIKFSDSSSYSSTGFASRKWYFSDSTTSTNAIESKTFTKAGKYAVALVVKNNGGCEDSVIRVFNVYDAPVASFSAQEVCVGKPTEFTNSSTVSNGTPTYTWDFGDSSATSSDKEPSHTYPRAGFYSVTLTVAAGNCSSSLVSTVIVNAGPSITFSATFSGRKVTFHPSVTSYTSYFWDFGDSATSTDVSPSHLYATAGGGHNVKVTVVDANGCTSTYGTTITAIAAQNQNHYEVKVYPNPFTGVTHLTYTLDKRSVTKVVLQDINGREVQVVKAAGMETEGQHDVGVDANNLASGVYLLKVIVGDQVYNERIEKLK